jgi:hypothetical protein
MKKFQEYKLNREKISLDYGIIKQLFDNSWSLSVKPPERNTYKRIYKTKDKAMEAYKKYMRYYYNNVSN